MHVCTFIVHIEQCQGARFVSSALQAEAPLSHVDLQPGGHALGFTGFCIPSGPLTSSSSLINIQVSLQVSLIASLAVQQISLLLVIAS